MDHRLIILATSCGGKSTLMRYLRKHTDLIVKEIDEEVIKANDNKWPDNNEYQNLIKQIFQQVITEDKVIYLAKDLSIESAHEAKANGFRLYQLKLTLEKLKERNSKRMEEEGYDDQSIWFEGQLEQLDELSNNNLLDGYIDGSLATDQIAKEVFRLSEV